MVCCPMGHSVPRIESSVLLLSGQGVSHPMVFFDLGSLGLAEQDLTEMLALRQEARLYCRSILIL